MLAQLKTQVIPGTAGRLEPLCSISLVGTPVLKPVKGIPCTPRRPQQQHLELSSCLKVSGLGSTCWLAWLKHVFVRLAALTTTFLPLLS
jgi:hypothetical protein